MEKIQGSNIKETFLKKELLDQIEKIKPIDILVGISAKNVESTIVHVMNVVSLGLMEFFPDYNNLVVVSDGFSTDRTFELAELFGLPEKINKIVTEDHGNSGKGCGIKTIFEIAALSEAKTVVTVDGDLFSIKPEWIQNLVQPSIYGRADLIVPFYVRDKYDGVITNNLAYPYTRSLYGVGVRQPIGGEYGLSHEMVNLLRKHPLFPNHFGIDIFMTTVASGEHMNISEALLGLKIHESATKYLEPGKHLIPMFRQVVGSMFDLTEYYQEEWKTHTHRRKVQRRIGRYYGQRPVPVKVDLEKITGTYKTDYLNYRDLCANILPEELFKEVEKNVNSEIPTFGAEAWAKTVFTMASKHKSAEKDKKPLILDALRVLWLARYASYVVETEGMDIDDAEGVIEEQARVFEDEKDYFISIY